MPRPHVVGFSQSECKHLGQRQIDASTENGSDSIGAFGYIGNGEPVKADERVSKEVFFVVGRVL
jgi:hypothetical protein